MQRLTHLKDTVQTWHGLRDQGAYLLELVEMSLEEGDDSLESQLIKESESFLDDLREKEMELTLSGPYDRRPAILSIQSGAGGVDSQDWSQMLLRMYLRWAERRGYKVQMLNLSDADGGGIKSAALEISGPLAFGYLKAEKGVHRLVRLSPFNSDHLRHTSFAQVVVLPTADEEDAEVEIRPEDLKIDFFRSSGPGGQNVQKVASAVRLTHLPTGLVVSCQTERSQHQNREYATTLLKAHLLQLRLEERAKKMAELRGERVSAEWGSQIRSYVLHPYRMVKDHRSQHQVSDATAVLDGDIDDFLKAYLLTSVGEANAPMHGTTHK
jgi:peptide chain release factor 2